MARMFRALTVTGCLIVSSLAAAGEAPAVASSDAFVGPWGGLYGGYGWAKPSGSWSLSGPTLDPFPVVINGLDAVGNSAIASNGAVYGIQGGWNWRWNSNFVLGLEGDVGRYDLIGRYAAGGQVPLYGTPFTINESYGAGWEAAARVRAGYAFNNFALAFVEAGPALADLHYKSHFHDAGNEDEYRALEAAKVGISVGAGVEFAITHNITVSAEYVFTHFPSLTGSGVAALTTDGIPNGTYGYVNHSSGDLNQNVFRLGLNYYLQ